jgi:hypothetical protein
MWGGNSVRRSRDPLEGVASGLTVTSVTAPLTLGNNGAQSDVPVSALGFANGFPGAWYDHVGAADVDLQRQWPPAGRRAADDTGELGLVPSEDEDSRTRAGQHRCRPPARSAVTRAADSGIDTAR